MGCSQATSTTRSTSHVPIHRINDVNNGTFSSGPRASSEASAPLPLPFRVKSVLKSSQTNGRRDNHSVSPVSRKHRKGHRTVNFDEQVRVKPRTPTPDKVWYEKETSTMSLSEYSDDDDDDDETIGPSDRLQHDNRRIETRLNTSTAATSVLSRHALNSHWYKTKPIGVKSPVNTLTNSYRSFESITHEQSNTPENGNVAPLSHIKVRQRLPSIVLAATLNSSSQSLSSTTTTTTRPGHSVVTPPVNVPVETLNSSSHRVARAASPRAFQIRRPLLLTSASSSEHRAGLTDGGDTPLVTSSHLNNGDSLTNMS
jgi:hypothetical protein